METKFNELKQHKADKNPEKFNEVLTGLLPKLERYIRHRLKIYELKKIFPKNYYAPEGIVGDIYLKVYEDFDNIKDSRDLKIKIFRLADEILESYAAKHMPVRKKISVDKILKEELKMLNEDYTVDADGDLILLEELDDISYKQDEFKRKTFLFDPSALKSFATALGLSVDDFQDEKLRAMFGSLYANLPETSRRILDLVSHAGLTPAETAEVVGIKESDVTDVMVKIKTLLEK